MVCKKVLILGGAGFISLNIIENLIRKKNYIFATDLAKYTIRLLSNKIKKCEGYNLCEDKSYSLQKIIDFLKIDTVSKNSKIKKDNYKNPKYLRFYRNKKVKKALVVHKIGNLEKSIKKTIIWYKQSI